MLCLFHMHTPLYSTVCAKNSGNLGAHIRLPHAIQHLVFVKPGCVLHIICAQASRYTIMELINWKAIVKSLHWANPMSAQ